MPATTIILRTYDPSNCTSVGWSYQWHGGRLMAERRSRWQGTRDGLRVLIKDKIPLAEARVLANCIASDIHADLAREYPVTNIGYMVR